MRNYSGLLKKSCHGFRVCLRSPPYLFITNISLIILLFIPYLSFAEPGFSLPEEKKPLTEWFSKLNTTAAVEGESQNYYIDNLFSFNLFGTKPNPNSPKSLSLQEWPAKISPGIRGGNGRTLYFVDVLIPFFRKKNSLFFVNPKGVLGSNDTEELNIGLGYRRLFLNDRMFLGINGYFDTQRSENNFRHNQLGFGLEAIITEWFDLRSNFYFPVSGKRTLPDSIDYRFEQRSFSSFTSENIEEPLRGLDYEGGVLIPGLSDIIETRAYLGGYHYDSEVADDIDGVKGRLEIRPFPLLAINLEVRDDNAFDTDVLIGGHISIPLSFKGWKNYWKKRGKRKPRERMTDIVVRDIDIISNKSTSEPNKQKMYDMVYVDNRNTAGVEDGSLDHPYNTMTEGLSALSDGEALYVCKGSGSYTGNFTVDNQDTIIWGSGHEAFPGCGVDGHPVLDGGGAGNVLDISADNVEIRGLKIQNGGSNGIWAENVNGGNIHHNIVTDSSSANIFVRSSGGDTVSNWTIADNTVTDSIYGIMMTASGSTLSGFTISGNTVSTNSSAGITVDGLTNGTLSNFVFSRNRIIDNNRGIQIAQSDPAAASFSDFTFTRNTITGNTTGIRIWKAVPAIGSMTDMKFGNASTGEGGYNSIYNNTSADFYENTLDSFTAENNYWGGGAPTVTTGTLDSDPYLTTDPN
jgi:hypothetical protein